MGQSTFNFILVGSYKWNYILFQSPQKQYLPPFHKQEKDTQKVTLPTVLFHSKLIRKEEPWTTNYCQTLHHPGTPLNNNQSLLQAWAMDILSNPPCTDNNDTGDFKGIVIKLPDIRLPELEIHNRGRERLKECDFIKFINFVQLTCRADL